MNMEILGSGEQANVPEVDRGLLIKDIPERGAFVTDNTLYVKKYKEGDTENGDRAFLLDAYNLKESINSDIGDIKNTPALGLEFNGESIKVGEDNMIFSSIEGREIKTSSLPELINPKRYDELFLLATRYALKMGDDIDDEKSEFGRNLLKGLGYNTDIVNRYGFGAEGLSQKQITDKLRREKRGRLLGYETS